MSKSIEDLKRIAADKLSFSGGNPSFYTGESEGLVKFDGSPIGKTGRIFQFTISNVNAAARTVLLCPGLMTTAAGKLATGAFTDKGGLAGLTGSGTDIAIEKFLEYVRRNPCKINILQIQTDQEAQLNYKITYYQDSPFEQLASKSIPFSAYTSSQDTKKMVTVPLSEHGVQFDDQTIIELPIAPLSSSVITLYIGGDANPARALANAAKAASNTLAAQ